MKIKLLTVVIIVFVFQFVSAQKLELGKVSIEELKETMHPRDSSATAAILFKKGSVTFEYSQNEGFQLVTSVRVRIKIYSKEGYKWANEQINFYDGDNTKESVEISEAFTYNLVNDKIEKTKLTKEGIFDEKVNSFLHRKKIVMPNIREGSVVEYQYTKYSKLYQKLPDWNFQTKIPVNYSVFQTTIPEYYVYRPFIKGYILPKTSSTTESDNIILSFKSREDNGYVSSTVFEQQKIDYIKNTTTYVAENLPAIKNELFVNNIDNYTTSVSHEISVVKLPNGRIEEYSTSWESVVSKIYESQNFGYELKKSNYFESNVDNLIKGIASDSEKIDIILKHVKSVVKFNNYFGYYCKEGVKNAYAKGIGNAAEMNLMLTAMLRYAGIKANPVLISTRSNGIALFPNLSAYNCVIVAVESPEGIILLDATHKNSTQNVLPLRDLNWSGQLIRDDKTSQRLDLIPKKPSREIVNLMSKMDDQGVFEGKVRLQLNNQKAFDFREKNSEKNSDIYLDELEKKYNRAEISDYKRDNDSELNLPIIENFSFKNLKIIDKIAGKIYFSPILFFKSNNKNPFKQENREYPVDFGFPTQKKYMVSIEIPEGYVPESMPKSEQFTTIENIGVFKYLISSTANIIQFQMIMDINSAIISPEYYKVIKEFFQKVEAKVNEKIVLKKI